MDQADQRRIGRAHGDAARHRDTAASLTRGARELRQEQALRTMLATTLPGLHEKETAARRKAAARAAREAAAHQAPEAATRSYTPPQPAGSRSV